MRNGTGSDRTAAVWASVRRPGDAGESSDSHEPGIALSRVNVMSQQTNREMSHAAIVIHANISGPAEAKRGLDEEVIPMMKGAPGFLGAYFVAVDDSHGASIEVFENEVQARAAAPPEGAEHPA